MIPVEDWTLARIVAQGLCEPFATPLQAVEHLGCVQGQDLPGALVSIALRTRSRSVAEVVEAFNRGELVRNWTMRGTLHITPAHSVRSMVALTNPRMESGSAARHRQLGIDEQLLARAQQVALDLLSVQGAVTRAELFAAWDEHGLLQDVKQRGIHLLSLLCRRCVLALGPIRPLDRPGGGVEQLVVDARTHLPDDERPAEDFLVDWVGAFLASHGPAHERDLARWTGLALGPLRRAIARVPGLASFEHDGQTLFCAPDLADRLREHRATASSLWLLPGFDEVILGYKDRSLVVPPAWAEAVVPGNNGVFKNTVVDAGTVVGTWRRPAASRATPAPLPRAEWFETPSAGQLTQFERAAARLPDTRLRA